MRRISLPPVCLVAYLLLAFALPGSWAADVKADLDADLSRDGVIDDDDPLDNGKVQETPPGLPITVGALEPIVLRCEPRSWARGYVRLTVVSNPGEWERLKNPAWLARPRRPEGGHIRVWKDPEKTTLILDSQNPAKMTVVWRITYASPMALVPPTLFVEGVVPSREDGDVVLVLEYGPTSETTGPESTRDILVTTVRPAELAADLVGDTNRDGTIDPNDPADNGEVEDNPPGLALPAGRVEKLALTCAPESPTNGYVRFTVLSGPGEWENLRDPTRLPRPRRPAGGHIRVWQDPERTTLILDSHDPDQAMVVWTLSEQFPVDRIPTTVYVEGLEPSKADGDVSLVLGYGLVVTTDQPELVQDILVATVRPGESATDLVGDINRDGTIDPDNPADNGPVEDEPPGLLVGMGQLQKLSMRCVPKSMTEGYVRLTVLSGPGEWENLRDPTRLPRPRRPAGGRIRVWQDPQKTTLILDSHVQGKMMVVWRLSEEFPFDLVPTTVYVEGLAASEQDGDVSLVLGGGLVAVADQADLSQDILVVTVSP